MSAPLSKERLDAIRAREAAATPGPWCTDGAEIYQGDSEGVPHLAKWIGETCRADEGDGGKADAAFVAAARSDVPALLEHAAWLQEHFGKALAGFNAQSLRVTELEAERHDTNEALDDAVAALRAKDARIAELEAERGQWKATAERLAGDAGLIPKTTSAPVSSDSPAARLAQVLLRTRRDVSTAKPVDATTLDLSVEPASLGDWEWWLSRFRCPAGQTKHHGSYVTAKGEFGRTKVLLTGLSVGSLYAAERAAEAGGSRG